MFAISIGKSIVLFTHLIKKDKDVRFSSKPTNNDVVLAVQS